MSDTKFNEMLARREVAKMPEQMRSTFMAMTDSRRREFIALVNQVIVPLGQELVLTSLKKVDA